VAIIFNLYKFILYFYVRLCLYCLRKLRDDIFCYVQEVQINNNNADESIGMTQWSMFLYTTISPVGKRPITHMPMVNH